MYNFSCFVASYAVLLQNLSFMQFTLFCREICFVAIYALWRGEKLSQKCCLWRKKDKYQVWFEGPSDAELASLCIITTSDVPS